MEPLRRLLPSAASGALFALAFPKAALWPLALIGLIPLLLAMDRTETTAPVLDGLVWGAGFFGVLLYWLYTFFRQYGQLGPLASIAVFALLVAYLSLYPGLFAHLGSLLLPRHGSAGWLLLPPLWVGLEWVRGRALTGFPWGLAGYSLAPCLPLIQVSALSGVYGVSFLVVSANVLGAASVRYSKGRPLRLKVLGVTVGFLFFSSFVFGLRAMSRQADTPVHRVALVQANVRQDLKWSPGAAREILMKHEQLTSEAAQRGARLVLWPESSSPFPLSYPGSGGSGSRPNRPYREAIQELSRRFGISLLFGTVDYRDSPGGARPVNAAALVRDDGSWGERYDKMHLVPFGEYVPLGRILTFVNRVAQGAIGDFVPGEVPRVVRAEGVSIGTTICYEAIFPELVRLFPLNGAQILANLTNDAWFGTSAGPYQHFDMAIFRAVENRRTLLRAANTGISAIVDPVGRVRTRSRLGETRVLEGGVEPANRLTLYTRYGDVFAILCAILAAAALAAGLTRVKRGEKEEAGGGQ